MNIEKHLCTLEQGIRLRELGVPQKSIFYYYRGLQYADHGVQYYKYFEGTTSLNAAYSLFTTSELLKMLPHNPIPDIGINYSFYHRYNWKGHSVGYSAPGQPDKHIERPWFQNEAEAKADLLIHLIEEYEYSVEKLAQQVNENP